jgi:hypothetical protein
MDRANRIIIFLLAPAGLPRLVNSLEFGGQIRGQKYGRKSLVCARL